MPELNWIADTPEIQPGNAPLETLPTPLSGTDNADQELPTPSGPAGRDWGWVWGPLARALSAMQHDPNGPVDVLKADADEDGVGGDDAADCVRYLVATTSGVITQRKPRGG